MPVLAGLLAAIEPAPRRRDVHVAVLLNALLRSPFLTESQVGEVLQRSRESALPVLAAVGECRVGQRPLFERFSAGWRLDGGVADRAVRGEYGELPISGDYLWYRIGGTAAVRRVARLWLSVSSRVTSGDIANLTGMSQPNVSTILSGLAATGDVVARGPGRGRAAHFVPASPDPTASRVSP